MDGNALEVALALMRLPSMRVPLRLQPLPHDMDQLIVLAAGTTAPLAAASARTGESPEQLLEAARFYIREVMLFPGADAYRVLGVSTTASEAQIKQHYRHLQHWLHPDRAGDDWESVFATRINQAWNELRTPARRAAYDAQALPQADAPHRVLVSEWRPTPATDTGRGGWWFFTLAVVGCLCLAWLALRQADAPAPQWQPSSRSADAIEPASAAKGEPDLLENLAAQVFDSDAKPEVTDFPSEAVATTTAMQPAVEADTGWVLDHPAQPNQAVAVAPTPAQPKAPVIASVDLPAQTPQLVARNEAVTQLPETVTVPPSVSRPATFEQVQLAQRRGRELTRFLANATQRAPPIWRNAAAQDAATSLQQRLQDESAQFAEPAWRIAGERARMTTALQHGDKGGPPATLQVELAWHDGMWLVDQVAMEEQP